MKLQYVLNVPAKGNATLTIPFGIAQVKLRGSVNMTVSGIGQISDATINQCVSLSFPIVNGKSPNTFTVFNSEASATNFYLFVEKIGGVADPNYFTTVVALNG